MLELSGANEIYASENDGRCTTFKCSDCGYIVSPKPGTPIVCPACHRPYPLKTERPPAIFECFHCGTLMDWYGDFAICPECGQVDKIWGSLPPDQP